MGCIPAKDLKESVIEDKEKALMVHNCHITEIKEVLFFQIPFLKKFLFKGFFRSEFQR